MVNSSSRIFYSDSQSSALLDLYLSSDASICSTGAFPPLGIVIKLSQFRMTLSNSQRDILFHCIAYYYFRADSDGLCDHLRDVLWDYVFKLGASAASSSFCKWVQGKTAVYIPDRKYQARPHSSPYFSAAYALAIVHRNHFFCLYKQNKSSESKVKFINSSNRCKRILEAAKLAYANKTKESITFQKLSSGDFWRIANSVLNRGKSAILSLFNVLEMLSSTSDIAKLVA